MMLYSLLPSAVNGFPWLSMAALILSTARCALLTALAQAHGARHFCPCPCSVDSWNSWRDMKALARPCRIAAGHWHWLRCLWVQSGSSSSCWSVRRRGLPQWTQRGCCSWWRIYMNYMNNMCIQYTPLFPQASIINVNNAAVLRKFKQWNRASTVKQTKRCKKVFLVKDSPFILVPLDSSPLKM